MLKYALSESIFPEKPVTLSRITARQIACYLAFHVGQLHNMVNSVDANDDMQLLYIDSVKEEIIELQAILKQLEDEDE
jgi:hypothetical protein